MHLMKDWKKSLEIFLPMNFKAFFVQSISLFFKSISLLFKKFWWLVVLYFLFSLLGGFLSKYLFLSVKKGDLTSQSARNLFDVVANISFISNVVIFALIYSWLYTNYLLKEQYKQISYKKFFGHLLCGIFMFIALSILVAFVRNMGSHYIGWYYYNKVTWVVALLTLFIVDIFSSSYIPIIYFVFFPPPLLLILPLLIYCDMKDYFAGLYRAIKEGFIFFIKNYPALYVLGFLFLLLSERINMKIMGSAPFMLKAGINLLFIFLYASFISCFYYKYKNMHENTSSY
jgi:hypothetical protein